MPPGHMGLSERNDLSLLLHQVPLAGRLVRPPAEEGHPHPGRGIAGRRAHPDTGLLETAGLDGAFVWTFADPQWTFSDDPRFALDMPAASLVKSYSRGHGTTYPDMTWEPRESFRAVADFYAAGHIDMPSG